MSKEDELFQAEHVYEQIEQLSSAQSQQMPAQSDARLISSLRQVQAEDREIVERVWANLLIQTRISSQDMPGRTKSSGIQGPQPMKNLSNRKRPKKLVRRLLELSVAILIMCMLVGGMGLLLQTIHTSQFTLGQPTAKPVATPIRTGCAVSLPAIITPLTGKTNPAVFYMTGGGGYQSVPINTSLIRYDLATHKQTTLVRPSSNSAIMDVSLSPNKQWLLLRTLTTDLETMKLQLMRTDGNMVQTVYESCTHGYYTSGKTIWSPNGQMVAFPAALGGITVLDLRTGRPQTFLAHTNAVIYRLAFWVNEHQLLLAQKYSPDPANDEIDLLDISKGVDQEASSLTPITSVSAFCGSTAISADSSQLFRSSCKSFASTCQGIQAGGPSTVSVLPAAGGATRTIYNSESDAVIDISPASASSLLIYIENTTGDLSQNGLWKINTDGTGMTRLATTNVLACQYSDYTYSMTQLSSDSQFYALLHMDAGQQKLIVGSLNGGSPTTIVEHKIEAINILVLAGIGVF